MCLSNENCKRSTSRGRMRLRKQLIHTQVTVGLKSQSRPIGIQPPKRPGVRAGRKFAKMRGTRMKANIGEKRRHLVKAHAIRISRDSIRFCPLRQVESRLTFSFLFGLSSGARMSPRALFRSRGSQPRGSIYRSLISFAVSRPPRLV